ncbi:mandelate racemase/muconate lactonizing enzyme family protein [Haloplanus salilacus]|uniref:mandelate racemase/muconate lactonizing enzyme family protein n=1 Tax=Haloplanus salilacus TaxID=2949994 RepID=UPI0030CF8EFB
MRVTDVEAIPMESAVDSVQMKLGETDQTVGVSPVVVKVHTDTGITGLGETLTYDPTGRDAAFAAEGVTSLARHLEGEDPRDVSQRWSELYQHAKRSGAFKPLSAIDEALWDIVGKDAGKPLYELLGGAAGDVAAYATFPHRKSTEELAEDGAWLADTGFDSMKITVGGGVAEDRERIRTVAAALPEGFRLSMDANTSYGFSEALRLSRTAEELEMEWFEEPIAHTDIEGQAELNRRVDVPIAAYQSHYPHYPAVDHLRANALDVYQPSLYVCGGVTAADRVATLVESFDERFVPHAFGPLVNYAASLHVAVASPACDLIEFAVYDDDADDPGQYVASPYVANQDEFGLEDGTISPPDRPGLGVELDDDVVDELRIE